MTAVILLAGGYGTRLARDLAAAAAATPAIAPPAGATSWVALQALPKPLLPVWGGRPLLDEWMDALMDCRARGVDIGPVILVTNTLYHTQFVVWAQRHGIEARFVVDDGTNTNETRVGAIADLHLALTTHADAIGSRNVLVLAGDTLLFESFHLTTFLTESCTDGDHILYYRVQSDAEVSKRGIVEIEPTTSKVVGFLEKPSPSQTTSRWACPAFYLFRASTVPLIAQYVEDAKAKSADANTSALDAPGQLVGWLYKRTPVYGTQIEGRYDIGGLADYEVAACHRLVLERAHARIGLIGNPSDGFNGKTLSVAVRNFYATVRVRPSSQLFIVPSARYDSTIFANLEDLSTRTTVFGYYGGVRLLRATCKRFFDLVQTHRPDLVSAIKTKNFTMSYDSNIPFAVGLAGSSAIVTAALRALMRFYGVTIEILGLPRDQLPNIVLAIEKEELGINAGLQDRVIQEYEGVVFMDFSKHILDARMGAGMYTPLNSNDLPPLYLAYMVKAGGDSGKIHSDVRRRWDAGDADVIAAMKEFARITDDAAIAIAQHDYVRLGQLMDINFDLRRTIYGDAVTGEDNIRFTNLARTNGFYAKFTGSGGAFVLLRNGDGGSLTVSDDEMPHLREIFGDIGFAFTAITVQNHGQPLRWSDS